jgi:hypothetical protein
MYFKGVKCPNKLFIQVAFRGRSSGWQFAEVNSVCTVLNSFTDNTKTNDPTRIPDKYDVSETKPGYSWAMTPAGNTEPISLAYRQTPVVLFWKIHGRQFFSR